MIDLEKEEHIYVIPNLRRGCMGLFSRPLDSLPSGPESQNGESLTLTYLLEL